jgi:hypothetical protein
MANDAAGMDPTSTGNELMNHIVGKSWPHSGVDVVIFETEVEIVASALAIIRSPFTEKWDLEFRQYFAWTHRCDWARVLNSNKLSTRLIGFVGDYVDCCGFVDVCWHTSQDITIKNGATEPHFSSAVVQPVFSPSND